ncbi:MAG: Na/Pi cotransporter family protein [Clostridia bacterium]|nr:Na/Pi cotransporter family protein [Clostridia bacterium]
MDIKMIFTLLGGVGLFLFGMTQLSSGLRAACGDHLRTILEKATRNPVIAVLVGIAVTVLIQSSSATDVMVVGFVSSGLMTLGQAVGVIIGASVGTTITAQITAFSISAYTPFILFAGAVLVIFGKKRMLRAIGTVLLGFGMLFQGIALMKSAIAPLAEMESFRRLVDSLENPGLLVLFGVLFTALLQSSSSSTVIFQAFAVQGLLRFEDAAWLCIGAAIGSVTPNLLASLTAGRKGRRCAMMSLVYNLIRAYMISGLLLFFPVILDWIKSLSPTDVARQVANAHTIFAVFSAIVLLPVSQIVVRIVEHLIPYTDAETRRTQEHRLIYLQQTDRIPPAFAVHQAQLEISRMGHIALENLRIACHCMTEQDLSEIDRVAEGEETVDYLTGAILGRLAELKSLDLPRQSLGRLYRMIQAADGIERISDHAENIAEYAQQVASGEAKLSEAAFADLRSLSEYTLRSVALGLDIFEHDRFDRIPDAANLEEEVDDVKALAVAHHVERFMHDGCDPHGGVIFTDMAIDLERCSDHALNLATALDEANLPRVEEAG